MKINLPPFAPSDEQSGVQYLQNMGSVPNLPVENRSDPVLPLNHNFFAYLLPPHLLQTMKFLHSRFWFDVGKCVMLGGYGFGVVCAWLFADGCIGNMNNMGSVPNYSILCFFCIAGLV